jgi:hypothetical protein
MLRSSWTRTEILASSVLPSCARAWCARSWCVRSWCVRSWCVLALAGGVPPPLHAQQAAQRALPAPVLLAQTSSSGAPGTGPSDWMTFAAPGTGPGGWTTFAPALSAAVDTTDRRASPAALVATGLLAAVASAAAGAVLGYHLERSGPSAGPGEDPGLTGAITGWLVAPAVVTPAVVHVVNGGNGSLGASYGAAALIGSIGFVALRSGAGALAVPLGVGGPLLQALSAAAIERSTDRRRD